MIRHYFLIVIALLFSNTLLLAQSKSGLVHYKIKPPLIQNSYLDTTNVKDEGTKRLFVKGYYQMSKTCDFLNFTLHFNRNEAVFNTPIAMSNDNGINILKTLREIGMQGVYYINRNKDSSIKQFRDYGNYWRVERRISDFDWTITTKTKKIQGYICRKATTTFYEDPVSKMDIVAWFAPDLPFQFGPLGFSGLPGLILELEYRKFTIYADKVEFSKKTKKINPPTKGKLVTPEEYDKIVLENDPSERAYRQSKEQN